MHFSKRIRDNPVYQSERAMERLQIGMNRLLSVLDREEVSSIRTLEMKISDAGPREQRVEPHILGLAGVELVERGRVRTHHHHLTAKLNWYAPSRFSEEQIAEKLAELAYVYSRTVDSGFTVALGDPLEVSVFKALRRLRKSDRRITFHGSLDLVERKSNGRFKKIEPPINYNDAVLEGPPDFILFSPEIGEHLMIECKNHREWIYPTSDVMKTLVRKAISADMTPVLIARRLPYITKTGLCAPAGILAHETYHQLYPDTEAGRELAALAAKKRGLGYFDLRATEETLPRTTKFFETDLPQIAKRAARRFQENKEALCAWARNEITWRQLFNHLNRGDQYDGFDGEMDF